MSSTMMFSERTGHGMFPERERTLWKGLRTTSILHLAMCVCVCVCCRSVVLEITGCWGQHQVLQTVETSFAAWLTSAQHQF